MTASLSCSRRALLQRAAALAIALPAVGLAACGGSAATQATASASATTAATSTASSAAAATSAAAPTSSAAASAAATTASQAAAPAAGGSAHLVYMEDIGGPYLNVAKKWAADFSTANPGVSVEFQPVVANYSDKLLTAFAGGTPPDVFRYLQEIIPIDAAVQRNLLLSLDSYLAKDKYDLTDFLPSAVDLYRWQNKLYALPRDYGLQVVYYNSDLFQKAGLDLPPWQWNDTTWTYSKYLDAAQKLTVSSGGNTTQWGCLVNTAWRPWATFVYNNSGNVVTNNSNGEATTITLTDANAMDGMQYLQDLMYKHKVAPRPTVQQEMGGTQLFLNGKVGMVIDNPSAVRNYRAIKDFKWDVATLPLGDQTQKRGTGGGGTGWAAAAVTKAPAQAWEFVKYISSEQAELDEVAIGGTTPSRKSVVNSNQFLDPSLPPSHSKTFADGQNYVVRDPVNPNWPEISQKVLTQQMARLWNGSSPAKDVAAAIKQQGDPLLSQGLQAGK